MRGRPDDFWSMEIPELMNAITGHRLAAESQIQRQYEIARMIGMWSIMPHSKKGVRPTDLITFPWEQTDTAEVSAEDRAALIARIRDRDAKEIISLEKVETL